MHWKQTLDMQGGHVAHDFDVLHERAEGRMGRTRSQSVFVNPIQGAYQGILRAAPLDCLSRGRKSRTFIKEFCCGRARLALTRRNWLVLFTEQLL